MLARNPDIISFWLTPWSQPFRAACLWFTPDTQPLRGRKPNKIAPWWVRPFFLQVWVGEAIAARLSANPKTTAYRHGRESKPCFEAVAWLRYPRRILRDFDDETLLGLFGMEAERLLRIAQEHPSLVGQGEWTCAALGASEHIAQVYAELKRRHRATRARAMLHEELNLLAAGQASETPNQEAGD